MGSAEKWLRILAVKLFSCGSFWRSAFLRCERGRKFQTLINLSGMEEYVAITAQVRKKVFWSTQQSEALAWIAAKSIDVEPAPLGRKLSRDPDDNLIVATAVAGRARFLVSQDRDLLVLEKPYGLPS
jgi:putative PIN family toxin of toxin-antitoxin system